MKRKIKNFKICFILILSFCLVGCFNYNDINKMTFTTSVIFDIDDSENIVVYLDSIKPYRSTTESSDKGKRLVYKGVGKTVLEAIKDVSVESSYKLNYSQIRAYIFTEKAAKFGVDKFLSSIANNPEFQIKPSVFVYYGSVEELMRNTTSDEEYLGIFLNELVQKNKHNPRSIDSNINTYFSESMIGNEVFILSSMDLKSDKVNEDSTKDDKKEEAKEDEAKKEKSTEEDDSKKIRIDGGSVIKNNKLEVKMDSNDSMIYNLIIGNTRDGIIKIDNYKKEEGYITLNILGSNVKDKLNIENKNIELIKNLEVTLEIGESQGKIIIDDEFTKYIEKSAEEYLTKQVEDVFNKYKSLNLDILNIKRMVEINKGNFEESEILKNTNIKVNTKIILEGTGVIKESL